MILVVNADDAGVDPARNRGILRAASKGLVRSASVLVNSSAARAVSLAVSGSKMIQPVSPLMKLMLARS